jgi:FkbM family methyltransferase
MYDDIIRNAIYYFSTENPKPYVIDAGANIGIATIYFKETYPDSEVVAFEPDPGCFSRLEENVHRRGYDNVKLVQAGLAGRAGTLDFMLEGTGSWGNRVAQAGDPVSMSVPVVRLRPYLERPVDLLKMNIEGMETEVLSDCRDLLKNVKRLVVEYHSFDRQPQTLNVLLNTIIQAGFRIYVRSLHSKWPLQPFIRIPVLLGMDLQLIIYGWRD